jgi:hypothetical protein
MSRMAQWPSHRAPSVGTQLQIKVAVSLSVVAQWPSRRAPSVGTELAGAVIQDIIGRGWEMAAVSMSLEAQ